VKRDAKLRKTCKRKRNEQKQLSEIREIFSFLAFKEEFSAFLAPAQKNN
jgi:hypothetical protein